MQRDSAVRQCLFAELFIFVLRFPSLFICVAGGLCDFPSSLYAVVVVNSEALSSVVEQFFFAISFVKVIIC